MDIVDSQPSAPEGVTDDGDEKDGEGASVVGLTDLNEQLKMSFAKLRRFVEHDYNDDDEDDGDDGNMVLRRAERDYKGDMEALSLEIEQVL